MLLLIYNTRILITNTLQYPTIPYNTLQYIRDDFNSSID